MRKPAFLASRKRSGSAVLTTLLLASGVIGVATAWSKHAESPALELLSGRAWLLSTRPGMLSEVNGLSGRAEASVKIPLDIRAPSFQIFQDDAEILVADGGGYFSVVDVVQHQASPARQIDSWSAGGALIRGFGRTYAVDSTKRTVVHLDNKTLNRLGRPLRIAGTPGGGVVAADGTLWVAVPQRGVAVPVRSGVGGAELAVSRPGDRISLVEVAGQARVVNWSAGEVTGLSDTRRHRFPVHTFRSSRPVSAAAFEGILVLTAAGSSSLVLLDLVDGSSSSVDLGVTGDYGPPVLTGDRLYVPDRSRGVVLTYDTRTGAAAGRVPVSGRAAPLEIFAKDGVVWANDPTGPDAVAIHQGRSRRIQKYRTSPTRTAETPATSPPASAPPTGKPRTTESPASRPPTLAPPTGSSAPPPSVPPTSPGTGPNPAPGAGSMPVPTRLGLLLGPYFPQPYTEREMSFSPNSKLFVLDGTFFDLSDPAKPRRLHDVRATWPSCNGATKAIAFDPGGEYLAIAGQENQGCLLSADGQRLQAPLAGPEPAVAYKMPVGSVAYSRKKIVAGDFFFNRYAEKIPVRLWDVSDPTEPVIVATLGQGGGTRALTFSHSGNLLVNRLTLWDVSEPRSPRSLAKLTPVSQDWYVGASFTDNGDLLVVGGRVWSLRDASRPAVVRLPPISGNVLAVNPAGSLLVVVDSSFDENRIELWDIRDRAKPKIVDRLKADWTFPDDSIAQVAFSPNGRFLAVMGGRSSVRLWRIRS